MRPKFFEELYKLMKVNTSVWALTGDLGYGGFDRIRDEFPERFVNCGASEQAMMGIACGLALQGKIPFVYSITPFLLYRPFETIRTYINYEKLPVKLVGSGRDKDYAHDGFSHDATDASWVLGAFPNITKLFPKDANEIPEAVRMMAENKKPFFISLKK